MFLLHFFAFEIPILDMIVLYKAFVICFFSNVYSGAIYRHLLEESMYGFIELTDQCIDGGA